MTARVLMIRHAAHDLLGRVLCGRMEGVGLNDAGARAAQALGQSLAAREVAAVEASPRLRAAQTAAPIGQAGGLAVVTEAALDEIDLGAWTGASFERLRDDLGWAAWNVDRLHHRPPGGESMLEVQARIAVWLERQGAAAGDRTIAAVTHAEVIKAACCHALGLSVDHYGRFDVDPGSITTILVGPWGMRLETLNWMPGV